MSEVLNWNFTALSPIIVWHFFLSYILAGKRSVIYCELKNDHLPKGFLKFAANVVNVIYIFYIFQFFY